MNFTLDYCHLFTNRSIVYKGTNKLVGTSESVNSGFTGADIEARTDVGLTGGIDGEDDSGTDSDSDGDSYVSYSPAIRGVNTSQ